MIELPDPLMPRGGPYKERVPPKTVARILSAVFGRYWKSRAAERGAVDPKTIKRWAEKGAPRTGMARVLKQELRAQQRAAALLWDIVAELESLPDLPDEITDAEERDGLVSPLG